MATFSIRSVEYPAKLRCDPDTQSSPAFTVTMVTDGPVPFPQIILWEAGKQHLFRDHQIERGKRNRYSVVIPAGLLRAGRYTIQAEGCQKSDPSRAGAGDWVKSYSEVVIEAPPAARVMAATPAPPPPRDGIKIFFGIHKHMHQPYYRAADPAFWDGEKTSIFDQRAGPYSSFIPAAVRQYVEGGLAHAGLSTSWSGSLIEQLDRCEREGLCYGHFADWKNELRAIAREKTALGNPRVDFTAFGFFHPLMALIPGRNIVRQIEEHRTLIRSAFGVEASRILFPPETAFHVRMIPALVEAGIEAVIYDSIHRSRACRNYPYGGPQEGMLPPNPAEQENPEARDWLALQNVWAASKISPSLLRPEYIRYEDPDGKVHTIIGVPAERYLGNEDARGGFGALQYPVVFGQLYDHIVQHGGYDPRHPPFFLLHSDGDNYGGGSDGYYRHNTGQLVEWLKRDPRFELTTVRDYLQQFPPDPKQTVHVEPGSWSGADNGDPQFAKWFSRYRDPYSPDLNSWAVLTALQNAVHSLEDANPNAPGLDRARRLMLTAETSCYWYWTGQELWDAQVTDAANAALGLIRGELDALLQAGRETTGPAIFPPWVLPENPGGKTWGSGGLWDAGRAATLHTFIHDISGLRSARLVLRAGGKESTLPLQDRGAYPSRTSPAAVAHLFTCVLPEGAGDVRYFVEAEDSRGNKSRSSLDRIFLA
ncbi:MAG TPA: glycosyl hydrolase family 57 [Kiritimatiellia bacterium]|nr:glycosyl hydrolase family 57 [Kiritimatiellia bacterium]